MKAYIIQKRKKIEPLFEEASEVLIKNQKLSALQNIILSKLNLSPVSINEFSEVNDEEEHLIFDSDLYFELELLKDFINRSKTMNCKTFCALKTGIFTLRTAASLQELKKYDNYLGYNLYYFPQKTLRNPLKPVVFDLDSDLDYIKLPQHMQKNEKYFIPMTNKPLIQINHWGNVWTANIYSILAFLCDLKMDRLKLLVMILKARSFNKWKVAGSANRIGKNCDIHPTAYLEGSTIGNDVIIGAGSVVRESVIGDGTVIGNDITIESTVVGENCTILNGHILYSVLGPGIFTVTHMISASIIGKNSFIGSGAVLTDFRLDGKTVQVIKDNRLIDTENLLFGCCLGNNVYLGSGCVVSPGRVIPSNTHVSLAKDRIITNLKNDLTAGFRLSS